MARTRQKRLGVVCVITAFVDTLKSLLWLIFLGFMVISFT